MKVAQKNMAEGQAYEARGVVAKFHLMGQYQTGPALRIPFYRFLTLDQGEGREAIPVEFQKAAPMVEDHNGDKYLDVEMLREGDIVVTPGLVYRRCLWFDNLMAAHMQAVRNYKRKVITVAEKDDAPAFDLGTLDATSDQVTKQ